MNPFWASVAAGVVANGMFVLTTGVGAYAFYALLQRRVLYEFWGLQSVRKIRIYVSHLRVVIGHPNSPEGRVGGALAPDSRLRSFQGSTVTLLETEMATLLRGLFFASLPGRAIQPAWLQSLLLTNADAEVKAAPLGKTLPEPDGTVVALGSPGYNSVSAEFENTCRSPVRFVSDNSRIELPGGLHVESARQGVVVRLKCADRYWFYAAGLSEGGTAAAAYYLVTSWRNLHKRYRKPPSFYAVVEISGNDFLPRLSRRK